MPHSSVERSLQRIEEFLRAFNIDDSELGIVMSPGYNEEHDVNMLDYYVKSMDHPIPPMDAAEPVEVPDQEFRQEVYPSWVDEIEARYSDVQQLQYLEPEELEENSPLKPSI